MSIPIRSQPLWADNDQHDSGSDNGLGYGAHEVHARLDPIDVQENPGLPEVAGQAVVEPAGEVVGLLSAIANEDASSVRHGRPSTVAAYRSSAYPPGNHGALEADEQALWQRVPGAASRATI